MVAMKETTAMIRSCKANCPNELASIISFSARKLKMITPRISCLLYTSDAADERSRVDLGGRRMNKKKKKNTNHPTPNHKTQ